MKDLILNKKMKHILKEALLDTISLNSRKKEAEYWFNMFADALNRGFVGDFYHYYVQNLDDPITKSSKLECVISLRQELSYMKNKIEQNYDIKISSNGLVSYCDKK